MAKTQPTKAKKTAAVKRTAAGTVPQTTGPAGINISVSNAPQRMLEVAEWRKAIDSARATRLPRRRPLIDIFQNIQFDGHLEAVSEKRKLSITTQKMQFSVEGGKGKQDDTVKKEILDQEWFGQLLYAIMGSIDYGYSLAELVPGPGGKIIRVDDLDRRNVLIDYGFLAWDYVTMEPAMGLGIYYKNDPQFAPYLLEIKSRYPLGKLATAALLIILKRGAVSDWAEFCQIVGIPPRLGKYSPYDDYGRKKLSEAFQTMGSNGWAVIPEGTTIEFANTNTTGTSTSVFETLAKFANEELSKLYLGQTMTTDNGSSKSQGQVHKQVEEMINLADMIWVEHICNGELKEKLINLGYKIPEGRFHFPETSAIPLEEKIKIDVELDKVIPISEEYWYTTYGVPKPTPEEAAAWKERKQPIPVSGPTEPDPKDPKNPVDPKPTPAPAPKPPAKKPAPVSAYTKSLWGMYQIQEPSSRSHWPVAAGFKDLDKIWDRIVKAIHEGKIKPGMVDRELFEWIKKELINGITSAMADKYTGKLYQAFLDKITRNVHVFSGFKTYQQLRQVTDMLKDDQGALRPFAEFKSLVQSINETYNVTYLEAEYKQAVAAAQMGAKWQQMYADRDTLGMLRFDTAGDDRVREEHARMDGITLPIDDSFWDRYYPPLDWGCRCDVTQQLSSAERTTLPSSLASVKDQFAVNWGKKGIVFPENHPYYNVRPEDKDAAENLFGLDDEQ